MLVIQKKAGLNNSGSFDCTTLPSWLKNFIRLIFNWGFFSIFLLFLGCLVFSVDYLFGAPLRVIGLRALFFVELIIKKFFNKIYRAIRGLRDRPILNKVFSILDKVFNFFATLANKFISLSYSLIKSILKKVWGLCQWAYQKILDLVIYIRYIIKYNHFGLNRSRETEGCNCSYEEYKKQELRTADIAYSFAVITALGLGLRMDCRDNLKNTYLDFLKLVLILIGPKPIYTTLQIRNNLRLFGKLVEQIDPFLNEDDLDRFASVSNWFELQSLKYTELAEQLVNLFGKGWASPSLKIEDKDWADKVKAQLCKSLDISHFRKVMLVLIGEDLLSSTRASKSLAMGTQITVKVASFNGALKGPPSNCEDLKKELKRLTNDLVSNFYNYSDEIKLFTKPGKRDFNNLIASCMKNALKLIAAVKALKVSLQNQYTQLQEEILENLQNTKKKQFNPSCTGTRAYTLNLVNLEAPKASKLYESPSDREPLRPDILAGPFLDPNAYNQFRLVQELFSQICCEFPLAWYFIYFCSDLIKVSPNLYTLGTLIKPSIYDVGTGASTVKINQNAKLNPDFQTIEKDFIIITTEFRALIDIISKASCLCSSNLIPVLDFLLIEPGPQYSFYTLNGGLRFSLARHLARLYIAREKFNILGLSSDQIKSRTADLVNKVNLDLLKITTAKAPKVNIKIKRQDGNT